MHTRLRFLGVTALLVLGGALPCAAQFTIVDANFKRVNVSLQQMDAKVIRGQSPTGPVEYAPADVVLITRDERPHSADANNTQKLQLVLRDGQRLTGRADGLENDAVTWVSTTTGRVSVPLTQIESISRTGATANPGAADATQDVLFLTNGDKVAGIISAIDATSITCQGADGQALTVEWANVRDVQLAKAGDPVRNASSWRLTLSDGTVCDVDSIETSQGSLTLRVGSKANRVSMDLVESIEHLTGRARLLTRLPTLKAEYAPFFPRTGGESTIDVPDAVKVGNGLSRSFIAVRPYSRLTWALDGQATRFRTKYAVAETGSLANCQVRIWLDDKNVLDRSGLTSATPLDEFDTALGDAKTLTLEVDFGENFDVQDQLYWIEPALVTR